jgi:hypothetical protein
MFQQVTDLVRSSVNVHDPRRLRPQVRPWRGRVSPVCRARVAGVPCKSRDFFGGGMWALWRWCRTSDLFVGER